jgi:histidine triad (HIT) family protein
MHQDPNCIFCKIVAGRIPSRKVYEDEELLAFHDINPWAPVHVLIIPKEHIATHYDVRPEHDALLGRMLGLAPRLMRELGVVNGFRTLINTGPDGRQEVPHLHMHVMGGPRPWAKG